MKKILFLLLFTIASYGQAVFDEGIQLTNTESTTATKVNVQEANGKVNTKTINTAFNKNFGLNTGDVVGAATLLNQYATTPSDWTAQSYVLNSVVFYGGKQWIAKIATVAGDVPAVSSKWEEITFEALATKTVTVDQTIIDGSTNAVSSNAVFDGLALKSNIGHTHVASQITDLSKASVGLGNVDNTSDLSKPLSTATQIALNGKENSFTKNTAFNKNFGTTDGTVAGGNDSRFTDSRNPLPNSANYIQNQNSSAQSANMWISGGVKAKSIQTLDDVSGVCIYGRYSSGQPYSLNILSAVAQGFKFTNSSATPLLTIELSGAATFASTVTASSFNGSATLTGTPTAPTAPAGTNTTQIATTAFVQAATRPYKVYTALLTQTGTNAPVATVLENTLGGTVVWSRVSTGTYVGTLAGVFAVNKTICFHQRSSDLTSSSAFDYSMSSSQVHANTVDLKSTLAGGLADGLIIRSSVEIRVYNQL